jgi:glycosyltransferase involved in cell wall biosynthesis
MTASFALPPLCLLVLLGAAPVDRESVRSRAESRAPELPRRLVDASPPRTGGRRIDVPEGADLQSVLDRARPGDTIALAPGAAFRGPFTLPLKPGQEWITIRTGAPDASLPPPGTRVNPSYLAALAALDADHGAVLTAPPGAHHYRFVGLEIRPRAGMFLMSLVQLGAPGTRDAGLPHHLVFDRCYVHGDPLRGARRGIALNSAETAIVDSYLSDFKEAGADSQAIAGWDGTGPFAILDNHLEGAGEDLIFGGTDPSIPDRVPSDITIRGNLLTKPLGWRKGAPGSEGTAWTVKNLLELKNARRVLIEGNLLEHCWPDGQDGFAVLFTVRNQDGGAPWSAVEDVTFRRNIVRHAGSGVNLLGHDDNHESRQTRRVLIQDNLFDDIGGVWGSGRLFQLLNGTADVTIDHNTAFQSGSLVQGGDSAPHAGFVFRNNIAPHNEYGIIGGGTGIGLPSIERYFPGAIIEKNVIAGGRAAVYPPGNFFPPSLDAVGFVDRSGGDDRLSGASPFKAAATDRRDPGADVAALREARAAAAPARDGPGAEGVGRGARAAGFALVAGRSGSQARLGETIFWGALALLAYPLIAYPVLISVWGALRRRCPVAAQAEPPLTVVVVAHQEAQRIAARIEDLLAQDYPRDRLEIVVASDGSTDGTVERARAYEPRGVRIVAFGERRGKPAVLNDVVPDARGEIVALADARQWLDPAALRRLVAPFSDPEVGAVSGELILASGRPGAAARAEAVVAAGVGVYWSYEKHIRRCESRVDSTVGATGALYAIRRDLFEPLREDTILDDVLVPMRIVRRGYRVLFAPTARVYDRPAASAREEFARKVRTLAGNFQLFAREPWLLLPTRNRIWFQTLSHKALRLLTPLLLAAALGANLTLLDRALYQVTLAAQTLFYAAALEGWVARDSRRGRRLLTVPYVVCLLSWATLVGLYRFATGRQRVTWERAAG